MGIVCGAIGLMTAGCCDFANIEKFSDDAMFRHLVRKDIPSQETFRQRKEFNRFPCCREFRRTIIDRKTIVLSH